MKENKWAEGGAAPEGASNGWDWEITLSRRRALALAIGAGVLGAMALCESIPWVPTNKDGDTLVEGANRGRILTLDDLHHLPKLPDGSVDFRQFKGQRVTLPIATMTFKNIEHNVYLHGGFGQLITSDVRVYDIVPDADQKIHIKAIDQIIHLAPEGNDVYHAFDSHKNKYEHLSFTGTIKPVLDKNDNPTGDVHFYLEGIAVATPQK